MPDCNTSFMSRALQLARKGLYSTAPNPRVGCVLVKNGRIVGEGWHVRAGEPHAEILALQQAGEQASGATAYVTLEPCSHTGKTPPCAKALIAAGISEVVAAMEDPNPLVAGEGLECLKRAGIEVSVGLLEERARDIAYKSPAWNKGNYEKIEGICQHFCCECDYSTENRADYRTIQDAHYDRREGHKFNCRRNPDHSLV